MIPIFKSHYSIGRSILTLDSSEKIDETKPTSIFSIAKEYNLKQIFLLEDNFSGFVEAYNNSLNEKIQLNFGLELIICNDFKEKTEESIKTESKINLWIINSDGYNDLLKIYSFAATEGFYYCPRIDWETLNKMMTKNLFISIPFYDSFIHKNNFERGSCLPQLENPIFHLENHDLPFDEILTKMVKEFTSKNKFEVQKSNICYYFAKKDIDAYTTFRCATNTKFGKRTLLTEPEIEHFGSDCFCFEHYLNLCQNQ